MAIPRRIRSPARGSSRWSWAVRDAEEDERLRPPVGERDIELALLVPNF
jgi:hypothetical protein